MNKFGLQKPFVRGKHKFTIPVFVTSLNWIVNACCERQKYIMSIEATKSYYLKVAGSYIKLMGEGGGVYFLRFNPFWDVKLQKCGFIQMCQMISSFI